MWWQQKQRDSELAALRDEMRRLAADIAGALNTITKDIHNQLERIDKQLAALAAVQGLRWGEGWIAQQPGEPEGMPVLPRPLARAPGLAGPLPTGHYL